MIFLETIDNNNDKCLHIIEHLLTEYSFSNTNSISMDKWLLDYDKIHIFLHITYEYLIQNNKHLENILSQNNKYWF